MLNSNERCAVFIDIDGTLIYDSFTISQENLDAIAKARSKGHMVFINTGRSWGNIPEKLKAQFDLDGVVAGSGAMVRIGDNDVYKNSIPIEVIAKAAEYFFEHKDCWCVFEGLKTNYVIANAGYTVREGRQIELKSIDDLSLFVPGEEIQVFAAGEKLPQEFKDLFADKLDFFEMSYYSDCVAKGSNKAEGIRKVCEITGIKRENTIAIGDSNNDLAMLEYAGVSVAMKNSQPHILDLVDYITESNADSGVAKAIEHFLLK